VDVLIVNEIKELWVIQNDNCTHIPIIQSVS